MAIFFWVESLLTELSYAPWYTVDSGIWYYSDGQVLHIFSQFFRGSPGGVESILELVNFVTWSPPTA